MNKQQLINIVLVTIPLSAIAIFNFSVSTISQANCLMKKKQLS